MGFPFLWTCQEEKRCIKEELEEIERLEENRPLDPDLYEKRTVLNSELNELLIMEDLFWLQHSNERWLPKADRNTAFYHRVANGRKHKNTIHSFT